MNYLRISIMLIAALMLFSLAAVAQDKGYMPVYYSNTTDPGNTELGLPPWEEYIEFTPVVVANGQSIWIGVDNLYDPERIKDLRLMVQTSGVLDYVDVIGYDAAGVSDGITATFDTSYTVNDSMHYYEFTFEPQPEWEVIELINNSGVPVTISNITASSICRRAVPSLTSWGLIILVLMILAAGYMVYRRRAGATA
jgi:hypothetical protein